MWYLDVLVPMLVNTLSSLGVNISSFIFAVYVVVLMGIFLCTQNQQLGEHIKSEFFIHYLFDIFMYWNVHKWETVLHHLFVVIGCIIIYPLHLPEELLYLCLIYCAEVSTISYAMINQLKSWKLTPPTSLKITFAILFTLFRVIPMPFLFILFCMHPEMTNWLLFLGLPWICVFSAWNLFCVRKIIIHASAHRRSTRSEQSDLRA